MTSLFIRSVSDSGLVLHRSGRAALVRAYVGDHGGEFRSIYSMSIPAECVPMHFAYSRTPKTYWGAERGAPKLGLYHGTFDKDDELLKKHGNAELPASYPAFVAFAPYEDSVYVLSSSGSSRGNHETQYALTRYTVPLTGSVKAHCTWPLQAPDEQQPQLVDVCVDNTTGSFYLLSDTGGCYSMQASGADNECQDTTPLLQILPPDSSSCLSNSSVIRAHNGVIYVLSAGKLYSFSASSDAPQVRIQRSGAPQHRYADICLIDGRVFLALQAQPPEEERIVQLYAIPSASTEDAADRHAGVTPTEDDEIVERASPPITGGGGCPWRLPAACVLGLVLAAVLVSFLVHAHHGASNSGNNSISRSSARPI